MPHRRDGPSSTCLLGEKHCDPLRVFALLAKVLVLAPQSLQLGRPVLLALGSAYQISRPALVESAPQHREPDAKILGDLTLRAPARPPPRRMAFKIENRAEPARRLAPEMLLFRSKKLFTTSMQVHPIARSQSTRSKLSQMPVVSPGLLSFKDRSLLQMKRSAPVPRRVAKP